MGIVGETESVFLWKGPNGIVLLSKDEYEVSGGTIRRKRRPAVAKAAPSDLPPGTVRGT